MSHQNWGKKRTVSVRVFELPEGSELATARNGFVLFEHHVQHIAITMLTHY